MFSVLDFVKICIMRQSLERLQPVAATNLRLVFTP